MKKYLVILVIVLAGALLFSVRSCNSVREDRNRLSDNQCALMNDVDFYRTRDSLSAAGVNRLTLTNREFKEYCGELERTVKSLNVKVKRLQSVSQTATETTYPVRTIVKDSIIPGRRDTLRCIDYRDNYLTLSGCVSADTFSGLIQSRDTIIQVIHRVPRRFWFIRFGCKAVRQEVVCRNPHSRISFTEYIELKK